MSFPRSSRARAVSLLVILLVLFSSSSRAAAQTQPIDWDEFGPSSVVVDFEDSPVVGLEGATIGNVTFNTLNIDSGSFLVEPGTGVFIPHSPTHMALKGDGFDGESNWPPPIVGATFAAPVRAAGAWISTPAGVIVRVQNAQFNDLATQVVPPNSGSNTFVGFTSTQGISRLVIEGQQISGIGFDDLIYEPLPVCGLQLTHASGNLSMQFDLTLNVPSTWNVWLNAVNTDVRLWSVPLPAADYPPIPLQFPFPALGSVGVLTTLTTPTEGITCATWKTVNTSAVVAGGR
jgi:hypothetical protein